MDNAIQLAIDQLRQLLQNPEQRRSPELRAALEVYGRCCADANRRLRECNDLISKGHYASAVELAEREPKLLTLCMLVDIPERDLLPSIAQENEVKRPETINETLFAFVQEGIQTGNSVEDNRRLLHKMTLARAPLPVRLSAMRRLAIQYPNHPFLDEDIRTFERAWFKDAIQFARGHANNGNAAIVEEIIGDLKENGYVETPARSLLEKLGDLFDAARGKALPSLTAAIRAAHAEDNLERASPLVDQWNLLESSIPDARTRYQVDEALQWFERRQRSEREARTREEAKTKLLMCLRQPGARRTNVESAYVAAATLGAVDEATEREYRAWLSALKWQFRRRMALAIGTCVLLVGILSAGGFVAIRRANHERTVASLVPELQSLIERGEVEAVVKHAATLSREVCDDTRVAPLIDTAAKEWDRRKRWQDSLARIDACPGGGDSKKDIDEAGSCAKTDKEKAEIRRAQKAWDHRRSLWLASRNQKLQRDVIALQEKAVQMRLNATYGELSAAALQNARTDLQKLQETVHQPGARVDGLSEVEQTLLAAERWQRVTTKARDVDKSVHDDGEPAAVLDLIARFLQETVAPFCPNENIADRAQLARSSLPTWKKAYVFAQKLKGAGSDSQGRAFKELLDDWKDSPSDSPPYRILEARSRFAEIVRQRDPRVDGTAAADFQGYLGRREIAELWRIHRRGAGADGQPGSDSGIIFYLTSEPRVIKDQFGDKIELSILKDFSGKPSPPFVDNKGAYSVHRKAPQSLFAKEKAASLWNVKEFDQWDHTLATLYGQLRQDSDMDALVKLALAQRILKLAKAGSEGFRQKLSTTEASAFSRLTDVDAIALAEINWLDAGTPGLPEKQKDAEERLKNAPDLERLEPEATNIDKQCRAQAEQPATIDLMGWILCNKTGAIVSSRGGFKVLSSAKAFVIVKNQWFEIGSVAGARIELKETAKDFLGWPVFVVADPGSP